MVKIKLQYVMLDRKIKSVAELSRETGISKNTIAKLVNEKNLESLKLETLFKLCNYLNCPLNNLIEYIPEKLPKIN